jgi:hypothetical protein
MNATTARANQETDSMMKGAADAMRDAAAAATEHAEKVRSAIGAAGPQALRSVSRVTYSTSYVISYGIVYAAVFVAQSLPQDNPLMHGLYDGGVAAIDALREEGGRN